MKISKDNCKFDNEKNSFIILINNDIEIFVSYNRSTFGLITVTKNWKDEYIGSEEQINEELRIQMVFLNRITLQFGITSFSNYGNVLSPQSYNLVNSLIKLNVKGFFYD